MALPKSMRISVKRIHLRTSFVLHKPMEAACSNLLEHYTGCVERLRQLRDTAPAARTGRILQLQPAATTRLLRSGVYHGAAFDAHRDCNVARGCEPVPLLPEAIRRQAVRSIHPFYSVDRLPGLPGNP